MCLTQPSNMIEFDKWAAQVESRLGRIPLMGRYHVAPRSIEQDYQATNKVLGEGCSGLVRMATSIHDSNKKFAVKSFFLGALKEIELAHLKGELETTLCLDHPNVARLADVYESDNMLYMVTECIEGGELFQRLSASKRFAEGDAAVIMRQVLLSLNYLHSHGMVHRDLKLENFLFESKDSDRLKLIDFGFSKFFPRNGGRMKSTCGTLSYLAPEVLVGDYAGSTCDLWSAGVIAFVLLSGSMPFHGSQEDKVKNIYHGRYNMKPETWLPLSSQANEFTKGLLNTNAKARLTAASALAHPWIRKHCSDKQPLIKDPQEIVDALSSWKSVPKFRRACLTMLAWSLCEEERAKFRDYFLALDSDHNGAISYKEIKKIMVENCCIEESKVEGIFQDLAHDSNDEIRYSDFVAVLMSRRIDEVDDSLLQTAFRKFDKNNSGRVTPADFTNVLGLEYDGATSASVLLKTDAQKKDGGIDFAEFAKYVKSPTRKTSEQSLRQSAKSGTSGKRSGGKLDAGKLDASKLDPVTRARLNQDNAVQQQCCTLM